MAYPEKPIKTSFRYTDKAGTNKEACYLEIPHRIVIMPMVDIYPIGAANSPYPDEGVAYLQ